MFGGGNSAGFFYEWERQLFELLASSREARLLVAVVAYENGNARRSLGERDAFSRQLAISPIG